MSETKCPCWPQEGPSVLRAWHARLAQVDRRALKWTEENDAILDMDMLQCSFLDGSSASISREMTNTPQRVEERTDEMYNIELE